MQLGPGPAVDPIHVASLRAAVLTGERLELTEPGESEDFGVDWREPAALTTYGDREPTQPWRWSGAQRVVDGVTWGGCIEVRHELMTAGRFNDARPELGGGVLLLETSEELIPAREFGWILRAMGERGLLARSGAILVARPPTSEHKRLADSPTRARRRQEQSDVAVDLITSYNPDAVIVVGIPFGHTRPQWIVPYGGRMRVDGTSQRVWADYH